MLTAFAKQHITHRRCSVTTWFVIFAEVRTFFCQLLRLLWQLRRREWECLCTAGCSHRLASPWECFPQTKKTIPLFPKTEFLSDNGHFCNIPCLTRDSVFILPIPQFHPWFYRKSWDLWGDYMTPLMHRRPFISATLREINAILAVQETQ